VAQHKPLLEMQGITPIQLVVAIAISENQDADLSPPVFQAIAVIAAGTEGDALTTGNSPVAGYRH
jgi:hypothetical protein